MVAMARERTARGADGLGALWMLGRVSVVSHFHEFFACFVFLLTVWFVLIQPRASTDPAAAPSPVTWSFSAPKGAFVVVVCGVEQLKPASVLVHSLRKTGTKHRIIVLGRHVTGTPRQIFEALGATVNPRLAAARAVAFPEASTINSKSSAGVMANSTRCLLERLNAWRVVGFSRVVLLDPLMLVLRNLDDLFLRPEPAAAPDTALPDRLNPSLLVLRPSPSTFTRLTAALARLTPDLPPDAADVILFNEFFSSWPQLGPKHHLEYFYNADVTLGHSGTWMQWVHHDLKAIKFPGAFERWDHVPDKRFPTVRRYDHWRWNELREMHAELAERGVVAPSEELPNASCHADIMLYSRGDPVAGQLSILLLSGGKLHLLRSLLRQFEAWRYVHSIYILPKVEMPRLVETLQGWNITKPVEVLLRPTPSSRLLPIASLATDAILLYDDSITVSSDVLSAAFKAWQDTPERLVGFFPGSHGRDPNTGDLRFIPNPQQSYSLLSLRLLLMHSDYLQSYTCSLPKAVHELVDRVPHCVDIALNLQAARLAGTPPLLFLDPSKEVWEEVAPDLESLTRSGSVCLNGLQAIMGRVTLLSSTEARLHLDRDIFTKMEFKGGKGEVPPLGEVSLPIYDVTGRSSSDANYLFLPSLQRASHGPEVLVFPSPAHPGQVLCIQGNDSSPESLRGYTTNNTYAVVPFNAPPRNALRLVGTTLLVHSRMGFGDRYVSPNILANLFYSTSHYAFMQPSRAIFFTRGGMVAKVSSWGRSLSKAVLGEHVVIHRTRKAKRPVCFERAVVTRRLDPVAYERSRALRELQDRAWTYCSMSKRREDSSWGFRSSVPSTLRVLLLHGDAESGGVGMIANLEDVVANLRLWCRNMGPWCELLVLPLSKFTNFCHQVEVMRAVSLFITVCSHDTTSNVFWMRPRRGVLEIVPYGIKQFEANTPRMYNAPCKWLGLHRRQLWEPSGDSCPAQDDSCRSHYRRRHTIVDTAKMMGLAKEMREWILSFNGASGTGGV